MAISPAGTRTTVLELVRRGRARTRGELALGTGLSRSVVAQVVAELLAEGLLTEHEAERPSGRGRPSALLRVGARPGWVAGLDLGHRHAAVLLGDLHHGVQEERRTVLDVDADPRAALRAARDLLHAALDRQRVPRHALAAVGLSVPYPVIGPAQTVAPFGHPSAWAGVRPRDLLRLDPRVALVVENDANAGAWGELVQEPDPRVHELLYVRAGDGLGTALVVGGSLLGGAHGVAGEIGHVRVAGCVLRCRCGRTGCLDALVSHAAHPAATAADLDAAGHALGTTLAQLAAFVDPDVVVLGGSLGAGGSRFGRATADAYEDASSSSCVPLRRARRGLRSEVWGAFDRATQAAWSTAATRVDRLALVP